MMLCLLILYKAVSELYVSPQLFFVVIYFVGNDFCFIC